jgi:hypothetical protein
MGRLGVEPLGTAYELPGLRFLKDQSSNLQPYEKIIYSERS